MIASRHFALFATSVATALLLSACQPATEDSEVMPIEEATQATNEPSETAPEVAHAEHDMAANDEAVNAEKMSDTEIENSNVANPVADVTNKLELPNEDRTEVK